MLAAIIGVGTELTTGQIIDKNSSWISKQLKEFGIPSSLHLVVPDDRALILHALTFASTHGDTMFVTGGLGPTTDDFTRDLIAEWSGKPLVFDEGSWTHVCQRLQSRSIAIHESQKQQCFYPAGSEVLPNSEGTAHGFFLRAHGKDVYVLPGPPSEIAAIWKANIHARIAEKAKHIDKIVTYSWDTLGRGESDVAHITEECLRGVKAEKGYRVHLPYVEVKMSFLESERAMMEYPLKELDRALAPITVARNGQQVSELLVSHFHSLKRLAISDTVSGKYLFGRLLAANEFAHGESTGPAWSFGTDDLGENSNETSPETLVLRLKPSGATDAEATIQYRGTVRKEIFQAPLMTAKNPHRRAMYFAERALIFWLHQLNEMNSVSPAIDGPSKSL
jgi:molybdenum cofactor synthesis domain-containing protein